MALAERWLGRLTLVAVRATAVLGESLVGLTVLAEVRAVWGGEACVRLGDA